MGRFYADANAALRDGKSSYYPRVLLSKDVGVVLQTALTSLTLDTVVVSNGATLNQRDVLVLDTEGMRIETVTVGGSTTTLKVIRGFDGDPATHAAGTPGTVFLDVSNKIDHDRVIRLPGLRYSLERARGSASTPAGTIVLDNTDRFWNKRPPTGIASWIGRTCRISLVTQGGAMPVNHFLVTGLSTNKSEDATLQLTGLGVLLMRQDASVVRNGQQWWENVPAWWLAQQILLVAFPQATITSWIASGSLLTTFQIPLASPYPARAVSAFGELADWNGTGAFGSRPQQPYGGTMCVVPTTGSPPNGLAGKTLVPVGSDLYARDPTTQVWTRLGGFGALYPNHKIMHVWWDATYNGYVGVGWEPDVPGAQEIRMAHRSGAKNGIVTFFRGNGETLNGAPTNNAFLVFAAPTNAHDAWDQTTPEYISTGHFSYRAGRQQAGGATARQRCVGRDPGSLTGHTPSDSVSAGVNIPVAVPHWIRFGSPGGSSGGIPSMANLRCAAWNSATGTYSDNLNNPNDGENHDANLVAWDAESGPAFAWEHNAWGTDQPFDFRFSIGQDAGCFALKHAGGELAFASIRWDAATASYKYNLWTLATTSGTVSGANILTPTYTKRDGSGLFNTTAYGPFQPYSLDFLSDDSKILVGGVFWNESAWSGGAPAANQAVGTVNEINGTTAWGGLSGTTVFDSSSFASSDLRHGLLVTRALYTTVAGGTRHWIIAGLNLKGLGGGSQHLSVLESSAAVYGVLTHSAGRQSGFCWDTDRSRVYWHVSDSNYLMSLGCTDTTNAASIEDSGLSPVPEDRSLLYGLVYDAPNKCLYGVSGGGSGAQANPEILQAPTTASHLFWQFANWLTDRIPLAVFEDTDCWEALDWIAAFIDGVRNFLPDGRFYLQPRPSSLTFGMRAKAGGLIDAQTFAFDDIDVDVGAEEVVNYAEVPWARKTLGEPTGTLRALARPTAFEREETNTQVVPLAANTRKQNIYLRCVQGGVVGNPDAGCLARNGKGKAITEATSRLRFAYLVVDRYVKSQLLIAAAIGANTIRVPLQAATDVAIGAATGYGDTVELTDAVTNQAQTFTIVSISLVPTGGYATLGLDVVTSQAYASGSPVTIRSFKNNRWSDHALGVTTLAVAVTTSGQILVRPTSVENLSLLQVIRLQTTAGVEEMRLLTIDRSTKDCTVARGVGGTTPLSTIPVGTVIKAYVAPRIEEGVVTHLSASLSNTATTASVDNGYGWTNGDTAIIDNELMTVTGGAGEGSTSFSVSRTTPVSHVTRSAVRKVGMFAPSTFFGVGNTGVSLRFDVADNELPFMVGDEIDVQCPGATLDIQAGAPMTAYNEATRQRMGGRLVRWEQGRTCPFRTDRIALEQARATVADSGYGRPHFLVTLTGELNMAAPPVIDKAIAVEDQDLLPAIDGGSPNGDSPAVAPDQLLNVSAGTRPTVGVMVRSYEIDPDNGRVTIATRAINPNPW